MRIIPMNMFSGRSSPSKAMRHGAEFLFVAVTTGSEFAKLANARGMMQTCLLFELFHMVKHRTKNSVPSQTLLKATDVWLPTKPHGLVGVANKRIQLENVGITWNYPSPCT